MPASYDDFLDDESDSVFRCRHDLFNTIHAYLRKTINKIQVVDYGSCKGADD